LPDGSGIELMTQLQAISKMPGIAISGFGNNGDIEKSLEAGFCEHLIKPVKLEKLEAAMERAVATETASTYSSVSDLPGEHPSLRIVDLKIRDIAFGGKGVGPANSQ